MLCKICVNDQIKCTFQKLCAFPYNLKDIMGLLNNYRIIFCISFLHSSEVTDYYILNKIFMHITILNKSYPLVGK